MSVNISDFMRYIKFMYLVSLYIGCCDVTYKFKIDKEVILRNLEILIANILHALLVAFGLIFNIILLLMLTKRYVFSVMMEIKCLLIC